MSALENGGPAFPVVHPPIAGLTAGGVTSYGMTLRDYFAVYASRQDVEAQAEVIREQVQKENGIGILPDGWQGKARYMHADLMLEARK